LRLALTAQPLGTLVSEMTRALGQTSHQHLISSACTASTQALALAAEWIRQGKVKRCLIGGIEVLCDLTVQGFKCMQLLSPNIATPFAKNRPGINLSEGAAFVCVEKSGMNRPLAKLSGAAMTMDAYHMTSPHPEGKGCAQAMTLALRNSGLSPSQIDWIHCHGTGSHFNDLSEGLAIKSVFRDHTVPVASTKAVHGHMLAASGILESIICVQALQKQVLLRTPGLENIDPEIPVYHPSKAHEPSKLRHVMKTTLGFGGVNGALVFSEASL
jgi:3-oxoacyl-(acyl-carrier-protein) synthase